LTLKAKTDGNAQGRVSSNTA